MIKKNLIYIGIFLLACQPPSEDQEIQTQKESATAIEDFTITNVYDAFGQPMEGLTKDFGFSALIKYNGKLILFDAGTNADILRDNVTALGIDLKDVDFAVGSHAHGDHLNGFDYLLKVNPNVKIYLPFDFYVGANINFNAEGKEDIRDSLPKNMQYFEGEGDLNFTINQTGRFWKANTEYVKETVELESGIKLIFTRSPFLGYGSKYPSVAETEALGGTDKEDDEIKFVGLPELSLALTTADGEVLVVGCSHSSVQKIIRETEKYSNNPISLLYGGYHMLPYGREEIISVAAQLKNDLGVKNLAPAHCTGHLAFKILKDTFGENYLYAGLGERIPFGPSFNDK